MLNMKNESNFKAHYNWTGPEIWRQTSGKVDAFVSGAGSSPFTRKQFHASKFILFYRYGWNPSWDRPISKSHEPGYYSLSR